MHSNVRGSGAFCDIERCLFCFFDVHVTRKDDGPRRHNGGFVLTVKPACEGTGGVIRSENVDMSSDKQGERPCRRKSKGSCLKLI